AALNQEALKQADYSSALEKFRRVARLKKELERRPPIRRASPDPAHSAHPVGAGGAAAAPALAQAAVTKYAPTAITPQALSVEEAKLRRVEESIRVFVRVADPKFRQIVPMRYFNLMLSSAEIEAYTADYLEQAGPRADAARMLLRIVAVTARITTEMEELKRSQKSRSVWKLHADSLVVLVDLAKHLAEAVDRLALTIGNEPEAQANSEPLRASLEKLRERTTEAAGLRPLRLAFSLRNFAASGICVLRMLGSSHFPSDFGSEPPEIGNVPGVDPGRASFQCAPTDQSVVNCPSDDTGIRSVLNRLPIFPRVERDNLQSFLH